MAARYAQHFLINKHAAERIVDSMNLSANENVLEIGPGKGALTELMLKKSIHLTVIEIDTPLVEILQKKFGANPKFKIIHSDIMDVHFIGSSPREGEVPAIRLAGGGGPHPTLPLAGGGYKVIGNLPYNLTSPIFRKVSHWNGWNEAYFMIQKEVADRMTAKVGTADYGALTVGMNLTAEIEKVFDLSETSFKPAPRVKSSVVRLVRREKPLTNDVEAVQRVIQAAFQQRRKTILNSLSHGLKLSKEKASAVLSQLGLDLNLRAEQITISQFVELSHHLRGE